MSRESDLARDAMTGLNNENFSVGGTGAAIFSDRGNAVSHRAMGDEYQAPTGLPEWKKPSFDDDDRVAEEHAAAAGGPTGVWAKLTLVSIISIIIIIIITIIIIIRSATSCTWPRPSTFVSSVPSAPSSH